MAELADAGPPGDEFVRRRWIPAHRAQWARECHTIMLEHGAVRGRTVYETRDRARWRARYLIEKMGQLDLVERWQVREHVDRQQGGYVWTVEYLGGRK